MWWLHSDHYTQVQLYCYMLRVQLVYCLVCACVDIYMKVATSSWHCTLATISSSLLTQAALVRQLKAQGDVPKEKIDEEVKKLLALKSKLGILPAKQTGGKKSKSKK